MKRRGSGPGSGLGATADQHGRTGDAGQAEGTHRERGSGVGGGGHTGLGGADRGANPIEHLLAALASCTVISYQVWAGKLGIAVDSIDVDLEGTIDLAGFLGTDETVRPGFQGIELGIRVAGPASEADYRRLEQAVAEHCPVLDNLTQGVPVTTTLEVAPAAA